MAWKKKIIEDQDTHSFTCTGIGIENRFESYKHLVHFSACVWVPLDMYTRVLQKQAEGAMRPGDKEWESFIQKWMSSHSQRCEAWND